MDLVFRKGGFSLAAAFLTAPLFAQSWPSFAGNSHHTALAPAASQSLTQIHWQTPVDLQPQYSGNELLIHYGSPLITAANTVLVPVKTGAAGGFRVDAHSGIDGSLLWSLSSDYQLPPSNWTPEFSPVLTPAQRLYYPAAGGTVGYRDLPDSGTGASGRMAFYGLTNHNASPEAYNDGVMVNTPLTSSPSGDIYFGFLVTGSTPLGLTSGIARIGADGNGNWVAVTTASSDASMTQVPHNCAPTLSGDSRTVYIAVSDGSAGYLVALDSVTLQPKARVRLQDPESQSDAILSNDASASPTVGPDGDVFYGVLENPPGQNHERGWLLHFDSSLGQPKLPGAFGWDDTASVVPASMVPSYWGGSSYLLMTKYNDYIEAGGSGYNRVAVLDPNRGETDPVTGTPVMNEVLTIAGQTPDGAPPAVKEWCINSAVVDPATGSILAGSEDGKLYRWNLAGNTLSQVLVLTPGLGEAYTPTLVGPDGTVYAINNATLFAVGAAPPVTLNATPEALSLSYTIGGPPVTRSLTITSNPSGVAVTVATTCPGLSATPVGGVTPFTTTITFQPAGLSPGRYTCSITVTDPTGNSMAVGVR